MKPNKSIENELADSMLDNLNASRGFDKINIEKEAMEAFQMINTAAEILDDVGYETASEYLTMVLSKFGRK